MHSSSRSKIVFSRQVQKFIDSLDKKQRNQIAKKVLALEENQYPSDSKKLKNTGYFRIDIGEYRAVYLPGNSEIAILMLGKRNDDEIYKLFKRQ